jgi:hypothetical protein
MNLTAQPQELGPFAFTLDEMAAHSRVAATQYGPEPAGAVAAVVETTAVRVALYLMQRLANKVQIYSTLFATVGRNGFAEGGVAKSLGGWMYPFEPAGVQ